jgi:5-methylcytosine-specific restriction protein B
MNDISTTEKLAEIASVANSHGSNSIIALAGVPGTGKSHLGAIAAQNISGEPLRVREIQFHQGFTYEEFVEGLRLDAGGSVSTKPGAFIEWNDIAAADESRKYVLLIEELTRANVSAVLGELLTYVEHRDRVFQLTYSRRPTKIAKNLIIVATFNPSDRSAIDIDAALLRRLRILSFPPSRIQLDEMLVAQAMDEPLRIQVAKVFSECESRHSIDFEAVMPFGHGIFAGAKTEEDLYDLWHQRIRHFLYRPLLEPHPFAHIIEENYPWK